MVRDKIIELKYAQETFVRMLNLSISKVSTADLIAVLRLSNSLGVHFYDCFYIVAAKESRTVLVSADEKMIKTAKKALPTGTAIHIKDYS